MKHFFKIILLSGITFFLLYVASCSNSIKTHPDTDIRIKEIENFVNGLPTKGNSQIPEEPLIGSTSESKKEKNTK